MKNILLQCLGCILVIQAMIVSCTPDDYTYPDEFTFDASRVDSVALMPNHVMLLADGHACIDLYPRLFMKDKKAFPDNRVTEDILEYTSPSGVALTRYFSTSDASLIGKTLTVQVKIKGTDLVSDPVSFDVVAPLEDKPEITIPVVFHIIQTIKDIESYGGKYSGEQIALFMEKMNHVFSGAISNNPVGVDTRIRFELALYDPDGKKMKEPGINRYTAESIDITGHYSKFLEGAHLVWSGDKYMNVWLISDREQKVESFGTEITDLCLPAFIYAGTPQEGRPEGIMWWEDPGMPLTPSQIGILYKLQEMNNMNRRVDNNNVPATNDLIYYVGRYLGLLPTYSVGWDVDVVVPDYCDDTPDYVCSDFGQINNTYYKTTKDCYFLSENIADDPTGLHNSVSKNQCERMRWVLENSPQRTAWKSDHALKGIQK